MKADNMWKKFAAQSGVNAEYSAWAFCGGGEAGDELARLVLDGKKTATASWNASYAAENEPLPRAGEYSVVL